MASVRFAPSAFRWNGRVGVALLPSLTVLAGFGGPVPCGVMLVGAMVRPRTQALSVDTCVCRALANQYNQ
jgi:hypothetical protein